MTESEQEKIKTRIHNLLLRTVENGCTEAEMLSAAEIAGRLMEQYGLTLSDVEILETTCILKGYETGQKNKGELRFVIPQLGRFCDCRSWSSKTNGKIAYQFFGFPEDVAIAVHLCTIINISLDTETARFKRISLNSSRNASHSFRLGVVVRIGERLEELKSELTMETITTTGRELVVLKMSTVDSQMTQKLNKGKSGTWVKHNASFMAGKEAGNSVNIQRGIGHNSQNLLKTI